MNTATSSGRPLTSLISESGQVLLHDLGLQVVPGRVRDDVAGHGLAVGSGSTTPLEMSNPLSDRICSTSCALPPDA